MVEIEKQQLWVWGRMEWKIDSTEFISAFLSERINNFQCGFDHHLIPLLYEPWIHEALRITWSGISVLALFCCCFCFGKWACRVHSCGENQSIRLVFSSNRENPQLTFVFCLSVWPPFHFFRDLASLQSRWKGCDSRGFAADSILTWRSMFMLRSPLKSSFGGRQSIRASFMTPLCHNMLLMACFKPLMSHLDQSFSEAWGCVLNGTLFLI